MASVIRAAEGTSIGSEPSGLRTPHRQTTSELAPKKDTAMAAVLRAAEGMSIGSEPAPLRTPHRQQASEISPSPHAQRTTPHRQTTTTTDSWAQGQEEMKRREEEITKRRQSDRRNQKLAEEREGIVKRQQEADAAARAVRNGTSTNHALNLHQLPAASAVPLSTAPSSYGGPRNLMMPLETPREEVPSDTESLSSRYSVQSGSSNSGMARRK